MALFDHFGWKNRARRLHPGAGTNRKVWWEAAEEFHPASLYGPAADFDPGGDYGPEESFDPMGSYTGIPEDGGEPVQDADDL